MPIELETTADAASSGASSIKLEDLFARQKHLSTSDRMFFTERLALLLETGNPLHESLQSLEKQASNTELRRIIGDLRESVATGQSFSVALARHQDDFPPTYTNLVGVGEEGGFLHTVLDRLREMDEKLQELNSALTSAIAYPAFLSVFSTGVIVFMLTFVFPKFSELFTSIWSELPLITRLLMGLSNFLIHYWPVVLGGVAVTVALSVRWARVSEGATDRIWLRVPFVRELVVEYQLVQFLYAMSLSLKNGVPLLDALYSCRSIVKGQTFRNFIGTLEDRVSQGRGISQGFREADFLPPLVPQMIATAEESGGLATVMGRVGQFYEREWRRRLDAAAKIAEPAMLLVMGVVVGVIVSSLILPIFKLSKAVH